jgi:hypothetical protein
MAKTKGISGVAIGMIGTGALLVRAAIRGTSPMDELKQIITGQRPEPLSKEARGSPIVGKETATYQGPTGTGTGQAHTTGREKPHVAAEMRYIADTWRVATYGWRARGSVPGSDHPKGLAIDAMLPTGTNRVANIQGQNIGNAIVTHYRMNADQKKVKYIIWWGRIWSPDRGWRGYFGPSPHKDHVHLSFNP